MSSANLNWNLWARQLLRVIRFEIGKNMSARRWLSGALAIGAPLFLIVMVLLVEGRDEITESTAEISAGFAVMFQGYILRLAIFFVAVDLFTRLYRGEIMEKTLHYYLLSPVRREVILLGKYLAGLAQMAVMFVPGTVAMYLLMFAALGDPAATEAHFVSGNGVSHAITYAGVAFLACVGYGAVFMLFGLVAKNPAYPAVLVLGWESLNVFLPPIFQKISIIHYLQSICPVPIPVGPFAVITDPTSPWVSVPGMLLVTLLILTGAAFLMRRAEVTYTND
jgi:ABC-type transport system involved in multi-copper enzyme maturation permease subunit